MVGSVVVAFGCSAGVVAHLLIGVTTKQVFLMRAAVRFSLGRIAIIPHSDTLGGTVSTVLLCKTDKQAMHMHFSNEALVGETREGQST